ncbi:MAG: alanine racemase [Planctomycetes bacterium]|nr:alanine racemase [Planctomycetota bacterium]
MDLCDTPTPSLVLDAARLRANCAFMAGRAAALGVKLRPHLKTAKCAEVARLATAGQFGGITVSTPLEAEWFAARGFGDITLAVGVTAERLTRLLPLTRGTRLTVITDSLPVARCLPALAARAHQPLRVLIEVDCGDRRAGVAPDSRELLHIAEALGPACEGVLTHAGHSYRAGSVEAIRAIAEQERAAAVLAAERLRAAGFAARTVSVGSTPTCTHAASLQGVTEMRPGVYMFGDLEQAGIASLPEDRIALSVLTTVLGVYPDQNKLIVDAGGLALSKDVAAQRLGGNWGYGRVLDVEGRPLGRARVFACSQEHGQITDDAPLPAITVGSRLRIVPNHVCMTVAAHPGYHVVEGSTQVEGFWPRVNGWSA